MQSPRDAVRLYRWANVLATLSLDVAEPYVPLMGLPAITGFKEGLKKIITELQKSEIDPEVSTVYFETTLSWASERYGERFSHCFYIWSLVIFQSGELEPVSSSIMAWRDLVLDREGELPDMDSTPPAIRDVRRLLRGNHKSNDVYRIRPSTEWDKSIYAWREYDSMVDAMLYVDCTIDCFNFIQAWNRVKRETASFSSPASIMAWGTEAARKVRIAVEDLGDPSSWPDLEALLA